MLIKIVYWPDAQRRGPDLNLIGKVVERPDELARVMLQDGTAVEPTDEDLAAMDTDTNTEPPAADPLDRHTKAELRAMLDDDADIPDHASKADLVAAVKAAQDNEPAPAGGSVPEPVLTTRAGQAPIGPTG